MNKPEMLLWLDDHRGRYIPHDFATSFANRERDVSGVSRDQWSILELGPNQSDGEDYWMTWDEVLNDATVNMQGVVYRLWQDGALWLVPEGMEWDEQEDSFAWPTEQTSCS
jgi:hypothetical protein